MLPPFAGRLPFLALPEMGWLAQSAYTRPIMTANIIGLIIGIIVAIPGTIMPVRKFLGVRREKTFFSLTLIPIAMFYIGFSYYYGDLSALHAEIVGLIIFTVLALLAQFMASWILVAAYVVHGLWDVLHEIFVGAIGSAIPWTQVPTGYAAFCLAYDLIIAVYVYKRLQLWDSKEAATFF